MPIVALAFVAVAVAVWYLRDIYRIQNVQIWKIFWIWPESPYEPKTHIWKLVDAPPD